MKKGDICLIIIAVAVFILWFIPRQQGLEAVIYIDGEFYERIHLDEDSEVCVESKFGKNSVRVNDGNVYITHASCPDRLCERERINSSGGSIVCLPNRLSVIIENTKSKSKTDVIL